MIHTLKCHPREFEAVRTGRKTHEIRKMDRPEPYRAGDKLHLREWEPESERYTGRECIVGVTHVTPGGAWEIPVDVCVMSVKLMIESEQAERDQEKNRYDVLDREEGSLFGIAQRMVGGLERLAESHGSKEGEKGE